MKSDRELQQDVLAELKWDPKINAANIGVEVIRGLLPSLAMLIAWHKNGMQNKQQNESSALKQLTLNWM